ncbi:hypothetical protein M514_24959 [Trichuris suis]|uniref:Tubulin-specific chaperone A n=1 Tax=Trichuris suis TaxID=68888 RepID=A0A085N042_9BILA|nr:hypothetical protein M514_24959 [Trichuris suis]KHJ48409.1 hypothetical protein D918_01680 [Trichuris suis]
MALEKQVALQLKVIERLTKDYEVDLKEYSECQERLLIAKRDDADSYQKIQMQRLFEEAENMVKFSRKRLQEAVDQLTKTTESENFSNEIKGELLPKVTETLNNAQNAMNRSQN